MKKIFFTILLLLSLWGSGGLFAQVVQVTQLGGDYNATPPTVRFEVRWNAAPDGVTHLADVWLFVDYQTVNDDGSVGTWTPATITAATATAGTTTFPIALPYRGFYLQGNPSGTFSATVTATLTASLSGTRFNWCIYASDYPPKTTPGNGVYNLHGSPPFKVNDVWLADGARTYTGCITALTDATGCPGLLPTPPVVTLFVPADTTVCAGNSVTLTATATGAASYSFDGGASWTAANTVTVAPTQDTTCTVWVRNVAGCIVPYATAASVTVYPTPAASFSSASPTACAGSSITVVADGGTEYCFTHTCSACEHNPYINGNDGPVDIDCIFENTACSSTPSNSYNLTMPDAGSVTVSVTVKSSNGCTVTIDTTITVIPPPVITLLSAATTTQQTRGCSETIETITYTVANAPCASVTGLPAGVTYSCDNGTLTISGAPTTLGTYTYTVTPTGACSGTVAQGTLTATGETFSMTQAAATLVTLQIASSGAIIDWGDGSSSTVSPSTGLSTYAHTYSPSQPHTITGSAASLTILRCGSQRLTALDVSNITTLTALYCMSNQLTSLDVSASTQLTVLECANNALQSLNLSANTALQTLQCSDNSLHTLNVGNNTQLTSLQCNNNLLSSLDVSANTQLRTLQCNNNSLISLDISHNLQLTMLYCASNQLPSLNVSLQTALLSLDCASNSLTALNLSANTNLTSLYCSSNPLYSLDVSVNGQLVYLYCNDNHLSTLNLSANPNLVVLSCTYNPLGSLNVSANPALARLFCAHTNLTALSVIANTALIELQCQSNALDKDALEALFTTLHNNSIGTKTIYIINNPGTSACDQTIATGRGWVVNTTTGY
jgi:hypothetical protein